MEFKIGDIVRIPSGGCLKKAIIRGIDGEVAKCYLCKREKNKYFPVSLLEEGAALWAAQVEADNKRKHTQETKRRLSKSISVPVITDDFISGIASRILKRTDVNDALLFIHDYLVDYNKQDAAGTEEFNLLSEAVEEELERKGSSANEFEYQVRERVWSSLSRLNEERKEADRREMLEELVRLLKNNGATIDALEKLIEENGYAPILAHDFVIDFDITSEIDQYLFDFAGICNLERGCYEARYDEANDVLYSISVEEVLEQFEEG